MICILIGSLDEMGDGYVYTNGGFKPCKDMASAKKEVKNWKKQFRITSKDQVNIVFVEVVEGDLHKEIK